MILFQILPKFTKYYKVIFVTLFLFTLKELLKNYSCVIFDNNSNIMYSLLNTKQTKLNDGYYYQENFKYIQIQSNFMTIFLDIKIWILKLISQNSLANEFTKTVLFNEKKLPLEHLMLFKEVGIYHLIVISGMHVVILIQMLKSGLNMFKIEEKRQKLYILIICCLYLLLIKCTFPVLYQILKLTIEFKSKNLKIIFIMLLMILVNYDNFNFLSFILTIIIQIILNNYKNFNVAIINISFITNILLFKYNQYYNFFCILYTPILIFIFEKYLFKFTLFNFLLGNYFENILNYLYQYYFEMCVFFNKNFNYVIYDSKMIFFVILVVIMINYWYFKKYENK